MIERNTLVKHNPDVRIRFDEDTRQLFPRVRFMFEEIEYYIPTFRGEVIFGSRAKGDGTFTSDVDGIFYVEAPQHESHRITSTLKSLLERLTPVYTGREARSLWWRDSHISVLYTPKSVLIDSVVTDLQRIVQHPSAKTFDDFRQTVDDVDRHITIGNLFLFSIGRKIGELRRTVFDTLRTYPDAYTSERYWSMIMHHLAHSDRSVNRFFQEVAFAHYPQTIEDGMHYFHQ